jgi:hypothetical protein
MVAIFNLLDIFKQFFLTTGNHICHERSSQEYGYDSEYRMFSA